MTEWLIGVAYSNITLSICFGVGVIVGFYGLIKAVVSSTENDKNKAMMLFFSGVIIAAPSSFAVLFKVLSFAGEPELFPWVFFVVGCLLFIFVNSRFLTQ